MSTWPVVSLSCQQQDQKHHSCATSAFSQASLGFDKRIDKWIQLFCQISQRHDPNEWAFSSQECQVPWLWPGPPSIRRRAKWSTAFWGVGSLRWAPKVTPLCLWTGERRRGRCLSTESLSQASNRLLLMVSGALVLIPLCWIVSPHKRVFSSVWFQRTTVGVMWAGAMCSSSLPWMTALVSVPGLLCTETWATRTLSLWLGCKRRRSLACMMSSCT